MATTNIVKILIDAEDKATPKMNSFRKGVEKHRVAIGAALTGIGLGITGMAVLSVRAFQEQQRAVSVLGALVDATGDSWDRHRVKVMAVTSALQDKTNFGDEQQIRVLSRMIPVLGSVDKALAALPAVLDAAAASGLGVESVAGTLSRALSGMVNTSESTGLTFDKLADFNERLELTFGAVGGAAEANVDPFKQLGDNVGDLKEAIGGGLIPVLLPLVENMRGTVKQITEWTKEHPKLTAVLVPATVALGGLALVIGPLIIALPFLAGGFTLVAAGLTALAGANYAAIASGILSIGAAAAVTTGKIGLLITAIVGLPAVIKTASAFSDPSGSLARELSDDAQRVFARGGSFPDVLKAEAGSTLNTLFDKVNIFKDLDVGLGPLTDAMNEAREASSNLAGGGGGGSKGLLGVSSAIGVMIDDITMAIPQMKSLTTNVFDMSTASGRAAFVIAGLGRDTLAAGEDAKKSSSLFGNLFKIIEGVAGAALGAPGLAAHMEGLRKETGLFAALLKFVGDDAADAFAKGVLSATLATQVLETAVNNIQGGFRDTATEAQSMARIVIASFNSMRAIAESSLSAGDVARRSNLGPPGLRQTNLAAQHRAGGGTVVSFDDIANDPNFTGSAPNPPGVGSTPLVVNMDGKKVGEVLGNALKER